MDIKKEAVILHERLKGKIEIRPKIAVDQRVLSLLYTPGVAEIVEKISTKPSDVYRYTGKGNSIAIVSDGSRVLGLGNRGAAAALPVMEGKALLYKVFGNVDAIPLCVATQGATEIISLVENISPNFGAINIEDIESPKCFAIVDGLTKRLSIPVFHDDQHGTAIVAVAALLNALAVVQKTLATAKIVILGAGAAGYGIALLLYHAGANHVLVLDSKGIISKTRKDLHPYKRKLADITNPRGEEGTLADALRDADVFIGVSGRKGVLTPALVALMQRQSIVFALSNPDSEIQPDDALRAGAAVVATGRSDYKNQVNNVVAFPFIMRKILDERIMSITQDLLYRTAKSIAAVVQRPSADKIIPTVQEMKPL